MKIGELEAANSELMAKLDELDRSKPLEDLRIKVRHEYKLMRNITCKELCICSCIVK